MTAKDWTAIGVVVAIIFGILGLMSDSPTNNIENSTITAPVNQGNGTQSIYYNQPKRNVVGIKEEILRIVKDEKIVSVDVKTSTIDSETEQFAADIKNFLTNSNLKTRFIYCMRGDKLPDGLYYSMASSTLTIFVGANNGSYILNKVSSLNICNMESMNVSVMTEGYGIDKKRSMELESWINNSPDPIPESNSYSSSTGIVGPSI
jgi:hypothetical protein